MIPTASLWSDAIKLATIVSTSAVTTLMTEGRGPEEGQQTPPFNPTDVVKFHPPAGCVVSSWPYVYIANKRWEKAIKRTLPWYICAGESLYDNSTELLVGAGTTAVVSHIWRKLRGGAENREEGTFVGADAAERDQGKGARSDITTD